VPRSQSVAITFVRSADLRRASEAALRGGFLRFDLDRDAASFETLDEAIVCANTMKVRWLARGWREIQHVQDRLPALWEPSAARQCGRPSGNV
jgi:hypothetical protein